MNLRPLTLMGIILSIVTGTSLGVLGYVKTREANPLSPANTLSEALRQVRHSYVIDISEDELLEHAIDGMMQSLDDHSAYLDPKAFETLQSSTSGKFGGIGIELGLVDGYFVVISPMDDTPAHRAGLKAGDRITGVDDEPVKGKSLVDLVAILRGKPGSEVNLSVLRFNEPGPPPVPNDAEAVDDNEEAAHDAERLSFALTRQTISVDSVRSRILEPGFGYVRISQFQTSTGDDIAEAIETLTDEAGAELEGLVIDLRNNPGGTLQSSVEVTDHFLQEGMIVYTEGRLASSRADYHATRGELLADVPIVVLINGGSASASEIVAGALQDHGRAQLMGSVSYGKGSVQTVLPLADDQAIKLTTAYYFTPKGRSIHETGIEPDIPFEGEEELLLAEAVAHLRQLTIARLASQP